MVDCTSFINGIFFNPEQAGGGGAPVIGDCSVTTNQRNGVVSYAAAGSCIRTKRPQAHTGGVDFPLEAGHLR